MNTLDEERRKLSLLCLLLFLMLVLLVFTTLKTIQEVRNFQQQNSEFKARDVRTIRAWMTIPVVSYVYQVPEGYLYLKLDIRNPAVERHATLNMLANATHRPVDQVIKTLQYAIIQYRQGHPSFLPSFPMLYVTNQPLLLSLERREA